MKRLTMIALLAVAGFLSLGQSGCDDASVASYNISKASDNF